MPRLVPGGCLPKVWGPCPGVSPPRGVHPRCPQCQAEGEGAPARGRDRHLEKLLIPSRRRTRDQGALSILGVSPRYVRGSHGGGSGISYHNVDFKTLWTPEQIMFGFKWFQMYLFSSVRCLSSCRWKGWVAKSEEVLHFHREFTKYQQVDPRSSATASVQVYLHINSHYLLNTDVLSCTKFEQLTMLIRQKLYSRLYIKNVQRLQKYCTLNSPWDAFLLFSQSSKMNFSI